ncbi:MAG: hypothetical protein QXF07_02810 [Candidatus Micrarchaeia archaeon]
MTEREEKIIKKEEKKEEKKPSLWQRMKKPLAAGLLGASLLFSPAKKVGALPILARPPPEYAANEEDKLLKKGYEILVNYWNRNGTIESLEIAKKIFDSVYKKTGNPVALDLENTTYHYMAVEKKTYQESKELLLKKLQAVEERLKIYPDDARSITEKHITLMALSHAAYGLYFNKEEYREYRKKDEIDLYYEDAIKYVKELIEFEKALMTDISNLVLKEYTSTELRQLSDTEKNGIINWTKRNFPQHEKMYEELVNEKRND